MESRNAVSIHAPRTGRDIDHHTGSTLRSSFNPRAPHGARRLRDLPQLLDLKFQSTRPARGATTSSYHCMPPLCRFNPRAPHGARLDITGYPRLATDRFNPRAPHGARPCSTVETGKPVCVSIHAPRTGRDLHSVQPLSLRASFNPRAPHGARHYRYLTHADSPEFQSTRPARGATTIA